MSFISRLRQAVAKKKQTIKVAWLGLDQAGKTTIIRKISTGLFTGDTKRTLGMNVDEFYSDGLKLVCWDIGGQETFREALWRSYMAGSMGVIFVVDSAALHRFDEAKNELWKYVFDNKQVGNIPILILANKQDLPHAKTAGEVARAMDLHKVFTHSYAIFPTSAKSSFNLEEALEWLRQRIVEAL
ncbi:MAG: ADP-ribosylation factor family protein [Candidatus Hodarchaeales archaeon]